MRNLWDLAHGPEPEPSTDAKGPVSDDGNRKGNPPVARSGVNWKGCKVCRKPHPQDALKRVWLGKRVWTEDGLCMTKLCECSLKENA